MIVPLMLGFWFLLASPAWAAVACGNETSQNATTTDPATIAYTPDAGSNRVLIVVADVQDNDADNISISSVTSSAGGTFNLYGTVTFVVSTADLRTAIYWSTDFVDGAQTISVDWSSAPIRSSLKAYTCTGVDTAFGANGPFRNNAVTATDTTTTATVDVTGTSATDLVIDAMIASQLNAGVAPTVGAGQTEMYNIVIATDNIDTAGSTEPGNGGTVTMSWTSLTGVEGWGTVAGALVEYVAPSSFGPLRRRAF